MPKTVKIEYNGTHFFSSEILEKRKVFLLVFPIFICYSKTNHKGAMQMGKKIETMAIIGLGAVGINFAKHIQKHMGSNLWIVADETRLERYQKEGIYYNQKRCDFHYVDGKKAKTCADLVLITTKFSGLPLAIETIQPIVDEHTLIMSGINGISSEEILKKTFREEQVIYTVAQAMDATKIHNQVTCTKLGELCFGDAMNGAQKEAVERIRVFFDAIHFPYTIKADIRHHQWGKFMLNVGLNQVVAIHHGTYETIQKEGKPRTQMLAAMREVMELSKYEGVYLSEAELDAWSHMCDSLSPQGKPSMAQDIDAKRKTEVELFACEVLKRAQKYHLSCKMNAYLYDMIQQMEAAF